MANVVGSLLIKIGADTATIKRDMEVISNVFNKFEKNTKGALLNVRNAMMGLVSIVAVKKIASEIKSVIDTVDKMRDSARILGVTTESLSKLQYAASLSGVSVETLQGGLQKMTKSIGQAVHGTGKAGDALKLLHINVKDIVKESPDEQFLQIADAISKVGNSSEQSKLSVEIFSKSGQELLSLMQEGRPVIEGFGNELQKIGGVVGTDFANQCDQANDAIEKFDKSVFGLKMTLVTHLVPALSETATWMTELINQSGVVAYNKDLKEYQQLTDQMISLVAKRKRLEKKDSAAFLGASENNPYRIWAKEELEKTKVDIEFTDLQIRLALKRMDEQVQAGALSLPVVPKPPVITEGLLGDTESEAKKKKTAYEKSIDDAMKAIEEEKKLITQADKWYNDARKDQADRDKEEAAVAIKTEKDKWKAIIGTNEKMSDEMIESYLTHLRDMGATEEEIIQSRFDVWKRHTDDWKNGMEVGLKEFQDSLGTETEQWADITTNVFDSMRNTAGDFASALMWDFDNIGESFRNMLKQMAMDISRTLVQKSLIDPLMDNIGDFVGGLFSGDSGVVSDIFGGAMPWHSGGIIPKYHAGGRVPGTGSSLGILQGGEYVIPRLHLGRGSDDMSRNDRSNNYDTESIASKGRYGFYGYGYTGGGYSQLQELINQGFQVPDYSGANIPSGQLNKWDIPQFGFYGSELMKQYGIEAKPGASVGMPISYYEKYGGEAEPRFLSRLLLGNVGEKGGVVDPRFLSELLSGKGVGYSEKMHESYQRLVDALEYAFSGGLSTVLEDINKITIPSDKNSMYRERIKIEAAKGGIDDYIYLMSALSGVGEGKSPWLSMLPGVPKIPYPTEAQDYLEKPPPSYGKSPPFHGKPPPIGSGWGQRGFMHSGGLLADEQMAILQAGEAVIPKKSVSMNRELVDSLISGGGKRFHEGGIVGQGQSSSPHITINVENRGSNPVNVTQGPTVVSDGRILATMVIDEIRRNPNMRNALRY